VGGKRAGSNAPFNRPCSLSTAAEKSRKSRICHGPASARQSCQCFNQQPCSEGEHLPSSPQPKQSMDSHASRMLGLPSARCLQFQSLELPFNGRFQDSGISWHMLLLATQRLLSQPSRSYMQKMSFLRQISRAGKHSPVFRFPSPCACSQRQLPKPPCCYMILQLGLVWRVFCPLLPLHT